MESQTKAEIVDTVFSLAASLGKDFVVRKQERAAREQELQMQKEIEQVKAGQGMKNAAPESADSAVDALSEAAELGERYDSLLARAEAEEECELCRSLISAAREKPVSEQREVIPELRDLISSVEDDAPRSELVETINKRPALKRLLREHMSDVQEVASSSGRDRSPARRQDSSPSSNQTSDSGPKTRQRTLRSRR